MYYVPDGTKECGYYECKKCGNRFLSLQTMEKIPCPDCEAEIDYEIGPDENMEDIPLLTTDPHFDLSTAYENRPEIRSLELATQIYNQ